LITYFSGKANQVANQVEEERRPKRVAGAVISLGLFLAALLPRALGFGIFATADEAKWVYRSAQFLGAVLRGDLAGTVVNLTPAVTTTWLGSLGLSVYYAMHRLELGISLGAWLSSLPEFRTEMDVLVAVRWPMVLLTSLGVVAFYLVARRLTSEWVARLFALLLAFDPHFISLSRVLGHDAPASLFTGLALLTFLKVVPGKAKAPAPGFSSAGEWKWLVLSGALAGLAWLSKSPTLFLIPFVGLVALVESLRRGMPVRNWILRLGVWAAVGWLVFVLAWPAAWRDPVGAPYSVVHNAFLSATDSVEAEAEGYWQVPDLGPFYYLVNGAFKLSLFATLGLAAWAWLCVRIPKGPRRERHMPSSHEWWLLVFAVLFTIFMTLGGKRSNRYILPAWPALYYLAAVGLSEISGFFEQLASKGEAQASIYATLQPTFSVIGLLLLTLPAVMVFPYYFSYFNPLLGGPLTAPRVVKIGWGEGLDQVGRWLDEQKDAAALHVGSAYASALAPFFSGSLSGVTAAGLDYTVLYVKQMQAGEPSPTILRYFDGEMPAHRVWVNGIEYARIYASPGVQPAMANEAAFDIGILPKPLAYHLSRAYLPIGEEVTVEVLWLTGEELPPDSSRLTLQSEDDLTRRPEERDNAVYAESLAELERRFDGLVVSRHRLRVPADLARGSYGLLIDGRPLGSVGARQYSVPLLGQRLDANFGGQVRMLGYTFDAAADRLRLVWQASPRAWADYTVFLHIVDAQGKRVAGQDSQPPVPTSQWGHGEVVIDERAVSVPDDLSPGRYHLEVGLYQAQTGQRLSVLDPTGMPVGDKLELPVSWTISN
jgi:hypothetical protein